MEEADGSCSLHPRGCLWRGVKLRKHRVPGASASVRCWLHRAELGAGRGLWRTVGACGGGVRYALPSRAAPAEEICLRRAKGSVCSGYVFSLLMWVL